MQSIYNKLVFIVHKKCNASCSICCFSSSPDCREKLDIDKIKSYIDQSVKMKDITSISFTGGEPFLEYRSLLLLVKYATQKGKKVTTITNGYWASSYEKAHRILSELIEAGLQHLNISHDSYHKQYVATKHVKNLLDAAVQLGLATTLVMVTTKGETVGSIVDELGDGLYGTSLSISPCLPAGAASQYPDECFDRILSTTGLRCVYGGNLVVGYEGTIFPCCSQVIYDAGLGIGNYTDISLDKALSKTKNNALLYLIRNEKMDFFIDIAKNKLGLTLPEKVVNVCELCSILFKKENIALFYPYIQERIDQLKREVKYE